MSTEKARILPFAIARVCGLPVGLLDELGIDDPVLFERTIGDRHFFQAEWAHIFEKMQRFSQVAPLEKSLLFASHDLLERLPKFRETAVRDFAKKQRQTALGLYDFLARAATKTSPFAQFCTVQLIDFQQVETNFPFLESMADNPRWTGQQVFEREKTKLRHTLNVGIFERVFDRLLADENFANQLEIRLNPALLHLGEGRFSFPFFDSETEAFQHLENNAAAEQLWLFFQKHEDPKTGRETLATSLSEHFDATTGELQSIVDQLVSTGFLETCPPVSGHEPDWAARFLNRIAFLSPFEKQDELAGLFTWLNGTAKQLGWLPIVEAQAAQSEASRRVDAFLGEKNAVPPEKTWFQDAATEHGLKVETEEIDRLIASLREAVLAAGGFPAGNLLARATAFFDAVFEKKEVGFLGFAEAFLAPSGVGEYHTRDSSEGNLWSGTLPLWGGRGGLKIGAALQVFRDESGQLCAVVNALFPGGGRVFSRFLPLFGEKITDSLKNWNQPDQFGTQKAGFNGQAFHNANLSPILTEFEVDFHGSRPRLAPEKRVSLNEIAIRFDEETGRLRAFLPQNNCWLEIVDLGLESPDSRTPVLQLLRAVSQPPVSLAGMVGFLENLPAGGQEKEGGLESILRRLTFGSDLVFRRKTWRFTVENLPRRGHGFAPENEWPLKFRAFQKREGLPRHCFYSFGGKPQFIDFQSIISLRAFQKKLGKAAGEVFFTEMLPLPGQFLAPGRAVELVVEFEA